MSNLVLIWIAALLLLGFVSAVMWGSYQRRHALKLSKQIEKHSAAQLLPSRSLIETAIKVELDLTSRGTVVFIDMDGFKPINDQYGKSTGDKVLEILAERLKAFFAGTVFLSRYCSDEFIVFIPAHIVHDMMLPNYLERLQDALSKPFTLYNHSMSLTASIGFYRLTKETKSPAMAIQAADIAMGESKRQGGAVITEFTDVLWQRYKRELLIKTDLQMALNNDQLVIYYQPIVDCQTHNIVAVEALVRWPRDDGFVPPSEFVAIAEQSRQIVELNRYILRQAVMEFAVLPLDIRLSVNIPASQVHATDLVADVRKLLESTGLESRRLYLELTETELVKNSDHVLSQLQELRELGVGIAIDDFGTGYSNLQYLKQLPVDLVKLDRSFIDDIGNQDTQNELTGSILDMLKSLGKYLIVEGIENEQQAGYLRKYDVDALQGYYFYKPMPVEVLENRVVQVQ